MQEIRGPSFVPFQAGSTQSLENALIEKNNISLKHTRTLKKKFQISTLGLFGFLDTMFYPPSPRISHYNCCSAP